MQSRIAENCEVHMFKRTWIASLALLLALGVSSPSAIADEPRVGAVANFGPNLETTAGGVCRQPEGLTIDPSGNLYVASNSDSATMGHICVINQAGALTDIIAVPTGTSPVIGL